MLSLKQKKFCEEYIISGNATDAAKKAGYSEKTAYSIGTENLKKPEIKKYIKDLTKVPQSARIATGEEVLKFFTEVMKNSEVGWKDRLRAAENLAKRQGVDKPTDAEDDQVRKLDDLIGALGARGGDSGK